MALIVYSERWCEVTLVASETGICASCQQAALTICEACGVAVCDLHEIMCGRCGRSYCRDCQHACVAGPALGKVA